MKTNSASQSNSGHRSTGSAISNKQKALLRIAKAQLGLAEEECGNILPNHGGLESAKDLLDERRFKTRGTDIVRSLLPFLPKRVILAFPLRIEYFKRILPTEINNFGRKMGTIGEAIFS